MLKSIINKNILAEKIHGCWLGKAIGGTLGGPVEGHPGPLDLSFYDPVPQAILPNDDLDLQLVWLHHLRTSRPPLVTPTVLARAWQQHVHFPYDEYGVCLRNMSYGLQDRRLGEFDNWFAECMGAAIRSELWACLAAGEPERAAGLAWADAACDHAGDGIWAEVFLAALEAAAFTRDDPCAFDLLDQALNLLPPTSRVRCAVVDTRRWWNQTRDWREVRTRILARHGDSNFTDVAQNLAFTILGWLAGEGDFGKSICIAVNCGQDTDCTGATLGAILGLLAPSAIPTAWRTPIGEQVVVSKPIVGIRAPDTLLQLTDWTLEARLQLLEMAAPIGTVAPRLPARPEDSPIAIEGRLSWAADLAGGDLADSPPSRKVTLPGHWIRRHREHFLHPVMMLQFQFQLAEPTAVRVMACGSTETAAWVDGVAPAAVNPGQGCQHTTIAVPSFHRGGKGHFQTAVLTAGSHQIRVAWARPNDRQATADLVVGLGSMKTLQWLPQAMTVVK